MNSWPPPPGGHKKFGIKCAFPLTQAILFLHLSGDLARIWLPHQSVLQTTVMAGSPLLHHHTHQYTRQRLKTTGNHRMVHPRHPRHQSVWRVWRSLRTHWFLVLPVMSTHERIYRKALWWKILHEVICDKVGKQIVWKMMTSLESALNGASRSRKHTITENVD